MDLKVATLNLRHNADRWRERSQLLLAQLIDAAPDLIALQEVSFSSGQGTWLRNQMNARLTGSTKRPYHLLQKRKQHFPNGYYEGVGILSKLPVLYSDWLALGYGGRVALRANVQLPSRQTVDFVTVHLHHISEDKQARQEQVMKLVNWLNGRRRVPHQIVAGDFNEVPTGPAIQTMKQAYRSAYAEAKGHEPVATFPTALAPQPTDWTGCLDYIFISSAVGKIKSAAIFCDKPAPHDESLYPSDHVGLHHKKVKKIMKHVIGLRCVLCGQLYSPDEVSYVCPKHGQEGILDVVYDYAVIQQQLERQPPPALWPQQGMFAYRPFLPLQADTPPPPLFIGASPLYSAPRLAAACGVQQLWVKDDGRNPTASLKDRASALAIMKAREAGAAIVTTASTGNAAAALAGCAASVGQKTVIFVPAAAPPAKIAQLLAYGATVLLVEGSYDDAFDLCLEATAAFGWYCRNTAYNPYMAEGKKTVIFELYDQLVRGDALGPALPTHIFVSVGDGCILSGVHKGLRDLLGIGRLTEMPKLMGVQAAGSAFLYDAWANDEDVLVKRPIATHTLADSISAGLPRDRVKALTAVRQSQGAFIQVSDEEILAAIPALAQGCGVFAEPAAAAAYAGLLKASQTGLIEPEARVALLITGNGLKDVGAALKAVGTAVTIKPKLSLVKKVLNKLDE